MTNVFELKDVIVETTKCDDEFKQENKEENNQENEQENKQGGDGDGYQDDEEDEDVIHIPCEIMDSSNSCGMIDKILGPKSNKILVLGESDFSFSLSIVKTLGNGHSIVSTSIHNKMFDKKVNRFVKHRQFGKLRDETFIRKSDLYLMKMRANRKEIKQFATKLRYQLNGKSNRSIVYGDVDPLDLRNSLWNPSCRAFDRVVFPFPFSFLSDFNNRNAVEKKKKFVKELLKKYVPFF